MSFTNVCNRLSFARGHGRKNGDGEWGRGKGRRGGEKKEILSAEAIARRDKDPTIQLPVGESLMADATDFHAHSNTVTTPNVTSIENQPRYVRSFPVIYYRCHTSVILLHRPLIARTALCLVHTDRFKGIEESRERERERMEKRGLSIFRIILSTKFEFYFLKKKKKNLT